MASKFIFGVFLLFSTWVLVGFSHKLPSQPRLAAMGGVNTQADMPCMTKLMPCTHYLNYTKPPAVCCVPLAAMIKNEMPCLCSFINNTPLLSSFNVTKDDAVRFANSCGEHPDLKLCEQNATSPSTPAAPKLSPPAQPSKTNNSSTAPAKSAAAPVVSNYGVSAVLIAFFVASVAFVLEAY
ncbi:hypothetical protein Tsubulata_026622 [Turnera subulata]|uniref:Bifunctional inhibitor/plant lipid transfer protein/seed storage helical domain-containing protein n=1 Tax=Turnera subulata TaxID=218843 RepID=A0A9Q0F1G4_9ROSI|nr:hypothetical protein Tsubulata_026622 [Turnera subulata]